LIKGNKRVTLYDEGQFLSVPVVKRGCVKGFSPHLQVSFRKHEEQFEEEEKDKYIHLVSQKL